jgi:hypothetical protein
VEDDQTWVDQPAVVLEYVKTILRARHEKEIMISRNRHIWSVDEQIIAGDKITIKAAWGGGMFPGGLVGWQEGVELMEWIIVLEAQNRLGQRNHLWRDRIINITRNGRNWDGGPPMIFDIFKVNA